MIPALIAAGASLVGGIMANRASAKVAERQMDFQEEMSNTSYQRSVEDMKKAGINPMLAAKVGGASTPPGALAHVENLGPSTVASAQNAINMQQAVAQTDKIRADTDLSRAQTAKTRAETLAPEVYAGLGDQRLVNTGLQGSLLGQQSLSEEVRRALLKSNVLTDEQRRELLRYQAAHEGVKFDVSNTSFAADVAKRKADAVLRELAIPESRASAKFYSSSVGEESPWLKRLLEVIKGISSARAAVGR